MILKIGDSYGGGKVAYILQSGDPGYVLGETHGLIAATADQNGGATIIAWSNIIDILVGGTDTAYGTGAANTTKIIAQAGQSSSAAKLCADYTVTVNSVTYDDWYLPSKDELAKLYAMKVLGVGGFADDYYWSSSENYASHAWFQSFSYGGQNYYAKDDDLRVRAVRAF